MIADFVLHQATPEKQGHTKCRVQLGHLGVNLAFALKTPKKHNDSLRKAAHHINLISDVTKAAAAADNQQSTSGNSEFVATVSSDT
jgi:hypothetical protein